MKIVIKALIFGLLSLSKIESSQSLLKPAELREQKLLVHEQDNLLQISVTNQSVHRDDMLESGTDCGYYSLFNGLTLADLTKAADNEEKSRLLIKYLTAYDEKAKLFGNLESHWKSLILRQKADAQASSRLGDLLHKSISMGKIVQSKITYDDSSSPDGTIISFAHCSDADRRNCTTLMNAIRNCTLAAIKAADIEQKGTSFTYYVDENALKRQLSDKIYITSQKTKPGELITRLSEAEAQAIVQNYMKLPQNMQISVHGRSTWLELSDIRRLYEDAIHSGLWHYGPTTNLFLFGDEIAYNKPLAHDRKLLDDPFKRFQDDVRRPGSDASAIVLLYTHLHIPAKPNLLSRLWSSLFDGPKTEAQMAKEKNAESSDGHWFTLVVNRVAGQNQFILADSLGNTVRTNHPRVNEFIAILLGQEQAPLQESAALLHAASTLQEKKNPQEVLLESPPVVKEPQAATSGNQSAISDQTAATEGQKLRSSENADHDGSFVKKSFTECYTFVKDSWTAKIILSAIIICYRLPAPKRNNYRRTIRKSRTDHHRRQMVYLQQAQLVKKNQSKFSVSDIYVQLPFGMWQSFYYIRLTPLGRNMQHKKTNYSHKRCNSPNK